MQLFRIWCDKRINNINTIEVSLQLFNETQNRYKWCLSDKWIKLPHEPLLIMDHKIRPSKNFVFELHNKRFFTHRNHCVSVAGCCIFTSTKLCDSSCEWLAGHFLSFIFFTMSTKQPITCHVVTICYTFFVFSYSARVTVSEQKIFDSYAWKVKTRQINSFHMLLHQRTVYHIKSTWGPT